MVGFEISYYFCNEKSNKSYGDPDVNLSHALFQKVSCLEGEAKYER